jgi:hypothetical protein
MVLTGTGSANASAAIANSTANGSNLQIDFMACASLQQNLWTVYSAAHPGTNRIALGLLRLAYWRLVGYRDTHDWRRPAGLAPIR